MFKVVEGLVPAMPADQFFIAKSKSKRQIKSRKFKDCVSKNIIDKSANNNTRPYIVPSSATDQYRHSYFVKTVQEWNQLDDRTVTSPTTEQFKNNLITSYCD